MLRVYRASGEEAFSIQFEDLMGMVCVDQQPVKILAVKRHLQSLCGQTRFKQRLLLLDGQMLSDDLVLAGPMDLQIIVCHFATSSEEQIQQLHDAAQENDILAMEQLLQRPQNPDLEFGQYGGGALHVACLYGCIEAAQLLLEANADQDTPDINGATPLQLASQEGHLEVAQLLLEAKADKHEADKHGRTPILTASQHGHLEVARLLLEAKADKDKSDNDGFTPIFTASEGGYLEVTQLLLEANAGKDKANKNGTTPMLFASQEGQLEVVRLLLEANADKDMADKNNITAMVWASQSIIWKSSGCYWTLTLTRTRSIKTA